MPKPKASTGEKNLISQRLIELRRQHNMSQRLLAYQLQLNGYDMDKNVITRIETNKRHVTDVELKAFTEIFHVSYEYLIDGKEQSQYSNVGGYDFFQKDFFQNFQYFLDISKIAWYDKRVIQMFYLITYFCKQLTRLISYQNMCFFISI